MNLKWRYKMFLEELDMNFKSVTLGEISIDNKGDYGEVALRVFRKPAYIFKNN